MKEGKTTTANIQYGWEVFKPNGGIPCVKNVMSFLPCVLPPSVPIMWTPYILPGMSFLTYFSQHSVLPWLSEESRCFSSVSHENSSLPLSRGCSGSVLTSRKAEGLSNRKYSSGDPEEPARGKQTEFLQRQECDPSGWKITGLRKWLFCYSMQTKLLTA